jgi:Mlc titration factor MtfA (ptsG expression regulator)
MDRRGASRAEAILRKSADCTKEGFDLMSEMDSKQMKNVARSVLDLGGDRLDAWKEIASYFGREVRTVQRWEKREGLPVHRQIHVKAGTVWAFKREIDAWFKNRCQMLSKPAHQTHHCDQRVNWSSPTVLMARQLGNSRWLWLAVTRGSQPLESDSQN